MTEPLKYIAIDQEKYRNEVQALDKGKPESSRLGQSIMLEESGPAPLLRTAILFCFTAVLAFIMWAQFAEIDEVSVASGEVIPSGTVQTIQHIDGGTIREIAIEEGDIVKKGQVLLKLDQSDLLAELKQLYVQQSLGKLRIERLRAFTENDDINNNIVAGGFDAFKQEQENLLTIQKLDLKNQQNVLLSQIEQRVIDFDTLKDQIQILRTQIEPLQEQMSIREGLLENRTLSRYDYLESKRQFLKEKGQLDELILTQKSTQQAILEARNRLTELNGSIMSDALIEMAEANAEDIEFDEQISRLQVIINRMNILAPVNGVIQGLDVNSIGTVIKPGSPIVSLVPIDQELVLETRIRPEDIGFLQIGQTATVKFTTYNYSRYGSVKGKLFHLSATTFEDEQGESFYKGKVALSQAYVGNNPHLNLILPGMTVTVDIHSGKKTLLEYLLKPIHTTLTQSFRER